MTRPDLEPTGDANADAEDVRLMQLSGGGDMQAFEQLVERHQTLVAGTVGRMLGDNSDVEDLAQQVFIRVWKSANRYEPRAKLRPGC
jgi:RNA polymerase sigma-70 factor (ECF subfamily)